MAIIPQKNLFCWENIDSKSDLDRLIMLLKYLPDEALMRKLEKHRGQGRDLYPIRPTWNSLLAGIVYEHDSIESLRRELNRNAQLRELCGFNAAAGASATPTKDAYNHFLENLMKFEKDVQDIFNNLVTELSDLLPDFGKTLAVDSKAINSHGKPTKKKKIDRRRDQDASWGKKKYKGKRKDGTLWETVKRWFGYKLHLMVDAKYELPVSYYITRASASDNKNLLPLVKMTDENHPGIIKKAEYLCADRGYDSQDHNRILYDDYEIKPVIAKRDMWKEGEQEDISEEKTKSLNPKTADNVVYNCQGTVFCVCPETQTKTEMAYYGFEKDRMTLKYRCPASVYGMDCKGYEQCAKYKSTYGKITRIPLEIDRRVFVPVARTSYAWKRIYKKRTSVERVNSRLDVSFKFENHYIRGMKKMKTRMSLALIVMLAMAVGSIKQGKEERMRSLVQKAA